MAGESFSNLGAARDFFWMVVGFLLLSLDWWDDSIDLLIGAGALSAILLPATRAAEHVAKRFVSRWLT